VKRAASSAAGDAYQGAFEAVMAVLVGAGFGYWVDSRWDTTPVGVIAGVVIGFAAMVLRLLRLGRELVPEGVPEKEKASGSRSPETKTGSGAEAGFGTETDADRGPAETPGLSDVWRDDATDERE
jgi:F0F1-type ATP synthase assembly protein I